MKNLTFYPHRIVMPKLFLAAIFCFGIFLNAQAQNDPPIYSLVSMMKVPQDGGGNYVNLERQI